MCFALLCVIKFKCVSNVVYWMHVTNAYVYFGCIIIHLVLADRTKKTKKNKCPHSIDAKL